MSTTLISPAELVGLALRRQIPINFEKAWEKGATGINPVLIALRAREANLMSTKGFIATIASLVFFVLVLGVIGDVYTMVKVEERREFWVGVLIIAFGLLSMVIFASLRLSTSFFGHDHIRVGASEAEFDSLKEFCADLSALCEWGGIDPKDLEAMGWEVLKQVTEKILVIEAEMVLQHDKTNADISTKYDTFLRLGLVKAGGYTKYFNEAREKIANRNRNVVA